MFGLEGPNRGALARAVWREPGNANAAEAETRLARKDLLVTGALVSTFFL